MKDIKEIHTTISITQVSIMTVSLSISSFGIVIQHPAIVYFWFLALVAIASMLATSFMIGIAYVISRLFLQASSRRGGKGGHGWFSRPGSVQA
jgi:hypothetical protein